MRIMSLSPTRREEEEEEGGGGGGRRRRRRRREEEEERGEEEEEEEEERGEEERGGEGVWETKPTLCFVVFLLFLRVRQHRCHHRLPFSHSFLLSLSPPRSTLCLSFSS